MYALLYWKQGKNGRGPELPRRVSFLLLADPGRRAEFGLFDVDLLERESLPPSAVVASPALKELIDCGKRYAPALALAREDVSGTPTSNSSEFLAAYEDRLRHHLMQQPTAGYFLAEVVVGEIGYSTEGGFYWIVKYQPNDTGGMVGWVSDDYFVYHDPANHFRFDSALLSALSRQTANG